MKILLLDDGLVLVLILSLFNVELQVRKFSGIEHRSVQGIVLLEHPLALELSRVGSLAILSQLLLRISEPALRRMTVSLILPTRTSFYRC